MKVIPTVLYITWITVVFLFVDWEANLGKEMPIIWLRFAYLTFVTFGCNAPRLHILPRI